MYFVNSYFSLRFLGVVELYTKDLTCSFEPKTLADGRRLWNKKLRKIDTSDACLQAHSKQCG